jgi:kinesin family protein 3/17
MYLFINLFIYYNKGLSEFRVQTADDVLRIIATGTANRTTRSTDFNLTSSRSHAILQLTFEIESFEKPGQTVIYKSKLSLVDLAGSEKMTSLSASESKIKQINIPRHIKELTSINKSLSSLGNVISALSSSSRSHIPYRDSKLTRLLQDSLGGNTRTILVACVAPTIGHAPETISTLQFADRAKSVMLKVKANTVVDDKEVLARAYAEIDRLKMLLKHSLKSNENGGTGQVNSDGKLFKNIYNFYYFLLFFYLFIYCIY